MDASGPDSSVERTGIVIVGAGIAGLAAATTLEQSNFKDYILVEGKVHVLIYFHTLPFFILVQGSI